MGRSGSRYHSSHCWFHNIFLNIKEKEEERIEAKSVEKSRKESKRVKTKEKKRNEEKGSETRERKKKRNKRKEKRTNNRMKGYPKREQQILLGQGYSEEQEPAGRGLLEGGEGEERHAPAWHPVPQ